jgi:Abnormal spindle-like microcephaly-assoc'd, ASPM-SPD-2-Hydin
MDVFVINMIPKSLSGEQNQDSEPNLAVNPANPREIAATAFTPDPLNGPLAPVFVSNDGGHSWALNLIVPGALPNFSTGDITLRFGGKSNVLYAGILRADTFLQLNVLRTPNYQSALPMTVLESRGPEDQPWVQAITALGVPGSPDRAYIGNNNFSASPTATVDLSLNAAALTPAFGPHAVTNRIPGGGQNGPSIRPVAHQDGTVYAVYFNWQTPAAVPLTADVVISRDDNWAQGATPFSDLLDPGDGKYGYRFAPNVRIPWANFSFMGQERVGSHLSIAVDPRNSSVVYVAWADFPTGVAPYSIHVRRSTNRGKPGSWSGDLRLVPNAINPALAINDKGHVGFLYQTLTGGGSTWETHVEVSDNGFVGTWWTAVLAAVPSNVPARTFLPYLGDYVYLQAVGEDFYGVFSANNTPDHANFPNGVVYQRNADFATHTLLNVNNVTPVPVSIDPFFFKLTVRRGRVATAIASGGNFGNVCLGSFVDLLLTINNSGSGPLLIFDILSSSPDFLTPEVLSYPLKVSEGGSTEVVIRFQPIGGAGLKTGTLTILSNDPAGPHKIPVSGEAVAPRLSLVIANTGNFGKVCVGSFVDEPLVLNNGGKCTLSVTGVASSSGEFLVPEVLFYPLTISAGDFLPLSIRLAPTSFGAKSATLTVFSNDPAGPHKIEVKGDAPSGKLAVTGSLCFGGVKACCRAERTISICNVGDCSLHVTSVAFKRKNRHWKLINNPFPATLHPGSCLSVVIRYKATERCPVSCELVITSDDPVTPIKTLDVMAYTIWDPCGCKQCCEDCKKGCCTKCHTEPCCQGGADDCCQDEEDDDGGGP